MSKTLKALGLIGVCLLITLGLALPAASFGEKNEEGGTWETSSYQHCDSGKVCLDWVEWTGGSLVREFSCCLSSNYIGTFDVSVCPEFRRHPVGQ